LGIATRPSCESTVPARAPAGTGRMVNDRRVDRARGEPWDPHSVVAAAVACCRLHRAGGDV
jgi:hypothetical protein